MLQALFDYFYNLFSVMWSTGDMLEDFNVTLFPEKNTLYTYDGVGNLIATRTSDIGGIAMNVSDYLALICSLISLILIIVLCCLFVYKLVRIVSGLFTHR